MKSPIYDHLLNICQGITPSEAAVKLNRNKRTVGNLMQRLAKEGVLFIAGLGRNRLYFTSREDAEAYRPPTPEEQKAAKRAKAREYERKYYNKKRAERAPKPEVVMTDEEKRERKRERQKKYYQTMQKKLGKSPVSRDEFLAKAAEKREKKAAKAVKPKAAPASHAPRTLSKKKDEGLASSRQLVNSLKQPRDQGLFEMIITPATKITICPSGVDTRFSVDPSIAGRGQITQDWLASR